MNVEAIGKFFVDIKNDIRIIKNRQDADPQIRTQRIASLALRFLGLALIAASAILLPGAVVSIIASPLLGTLASLFLIFTIAVAHDVIIVGCNKRRLIGGANNGINNAVLGNQQGNPAAIGFVNRLRAAGRLGLAVGREMFHNMPVESEGTWLLRPMHNVFHYHHIQNNNPQPQQNQ